MNELTPAELDEFQQKLLRLQSELEAVVESSKAASAPVQLDQQSVGRLSRMDALQSQAMAQETERRRIVALRKIKAALIRLEEGEFGYCSACGEAIARGRLELDPAAVTCISHAQ